jgi:hypothetical protein
VAVATGLRFQTNEIVPVNGSAGNSDAAIDIGKSNIRFKDLHLSGGVNFDDNPTAVTGNVSSKTLDDYEEGTWTAQVRYGSSTGTAATMSESGGSYTKIGRQVTVHFEADVSNTNSGSGVVWITGLPFTVAGLLYPTGVEANGNVGYFYQFATSVNSLSIYAIDSSDGMILTGLTGSTATSASELTAAHMGTGEMRGSLTYFTS